MWQSVRSPLLTVFFIFAGFFLFTKFFGPIPLSVNSITTTKNTLFTVQGTADAIIIPDTDLISLGVTKDAAKVESAKNQVNTIINRITDDIKKLGVDVKDIKTTNFSVNPQYDYITGRNEVKGYTVSADIQVKVKPIEKANNVIDVATKDGATQVGGIQFVVDDQKQKELENQARKDAIKNAKDKAQSIAQAAGIHLGRIVDVQENPTSYPQPYPMVNTMKADSAAAAPETQLNPGENKITSTVSLSYETY
jgi:uncharacterized protein YggE